MISPGLNGFLYCWVSPVAISGLGFLSYQYSSILKPARAPADVFLTFITVTIALPTFLGCPLTTSIVATPLKIFANLAGAASGGVVAVVGAALAAGACAGFDWAEAAGALRVTRKQMADANARRCM